MKRTETRFLPKSAGVELRVEGGGDKPTKIVGYAAVFNSASQLLGEGNRSFIETIRPGAFKELLASADCRGRYNHDAILGRTKAGTCRIAEDAVGLRYEIDLPDTTAGRDVAESIRRGDVDGSSFAFRIQPSGESWKMGDGGIAQREITKVSELLDVGPVDFPAYEATAGTVGLRTLPSFSRRAMTLLFDEKREDAAAAGGSSGSTVVVALDAAAATLQTLITSGRNVVDLGNAGEDIAAALVAMATSAQSAITAARSGVDAIVALPANAMASEDEEESIESFEGYANTASSTCMQVRGVCLDDGGDQAMTALSSITAAAEAVSYLNYVAWCYQVGCMRSRRTVIRDVSSPAPRTAPDAGASLAGFRRQLELVKA